VFSILFSCSFALEGDPIPNEDWGYIPIDSQFGSSMFWWLYGSEAANRTEVPLVMWLQGGPGGSSLFGDFLEIGPVDAFENPRNTTWLKYANLIFVDNPVGTGFSYTNNVKGFSTTDQEIADNLVMFMIGFLNIYPIFSKMPFWIFSESYGGKMTANFGVALDKAIQNGALKMDQFMGVALGDSWIDPVGCMYSYPPFLYGISLIDAKEADNLTTYAVMADEAWQAGNGNQATNLWGIQQSFLEQYAAEVNIYNFMYYYDYLPENQLTQLIDTTIRAKLGIIPSNVTWGGQSNQVFEYMSQDFMRPGIAAVDTLLARGYNVAVYSGQMDIIVDVICIENWMNQLTWPGLDNFLAATREIQFIDGTPNGYKKSYSNLALWGVYDAGHMVPADNGEMALRMFTSIIGAEL